ncbi:hypothetical protein [Pseudorhodoferax sp.]|uniref:hypothetical protein n=1 Tax=Pseudorhodoferax sp. TaxID=1993553 RepID=UPI002DD69988|nr:hypothetical protein [Pseudorhodoferax sp.]
MTIPRLELADMRADLQDYLAPRVARLRYLGELFKCAAHAPGVLLLFMRFTDELKQALPDRITETAVLTTATLMANAYERHQHERLCIRLGYTAAWIAEVEDCQPGAARQMDEVERAVQRYVIAAVESRGLAAQQPFERMQALLGPAQAMAVVLLVGRYITHALAVNTLGLAPPVPSIFEDGFRGDTPSPAPDATATA